MTREEMQARINAANNLTNDINAQIKAVEDFDLSKFNTLPKNKVLEGVQLLSVSDRYDNFGRWIFTLECEYEGVVCYQDIKVSYVDNDPINGYRTSFLKRMAPLCQLILGVLPAGNQVSERLNERLAINGETTINMYIEPFAEPIKGVVRSWDEVCFDQKKLECIKAEENAKEVLNK